MADTERTKAELLAIFADAQPPGSINPQDMRDYVVTADIVNTRFSTGLITGGEVTINGGDNTKIDIADGTGFYTDNTTDPLNPTRLKVSWTGLAAQSVPDLATQPQAFVGLNLSSGTAAVTFQFTPYTPEERRDIVTLAGTFTFDALTVGLVGSDVVFSLDIQQTLTDLAAALMPINIARGNVFGANGANLTMDKSAGSTFVLGANFHTSKKSPNIITSALQSPVPSFLYTIRDGSGGFETLFPAVSDIDPENFDNNTGSLVTVTNNRFTIQRIYFFSTTAFTTIAYGQTEYMTLDVAVAAINTEEFDINPGSSGFRGWLIIKKGVTNLTQGIIDSEVRFIPAGMFGDVLRS